MDLIITFHLINHSNHDQKLHVRYKNLLRLISYICLNFSINFKKLFELDLFIFHRANLL
jgi:hypothetical protein